ncbi:hypothetical protein PTB13_11855, partial [Bacillus sp. MHSD17]|nr:hypothetical protein [Bacillus sp. MHSD17]
AKELLRTFVFLRPLGLRLTKYEYIPKQEDIITGMADLSRMKEMLQQPEHYIERQFRSECISCAFRSECQGEEVKKEAEQKKNIVH